MPKITNIKIEENDVVEFVKKATDIVKKNITDADSKLNLNLLDLLPKEKYNTVSFIIKNTNSSFANAIRRTIVSEVPVWSLALDVRDYETNDPFLIFDHLATKIGSLPIHQEYIHKFEQNGDNPNDIYTFYINIENNSSELKYIYSDDIIINGTSSINKEFSIIKNIPLQYLTPNTFLRTKLILEKGYGYQNGAKFSITPMPVYYPNDYIPLETKHKAASSGHSSLITDYKEFYFKYDTYTHYKDPLIILKMAINEIKKRINNILNYIDEYIKDPMIPDDIHTNFKKKIVIYKNEFIEIKKENHTYFIIIQGESVTISKLFSRYVYDEHKHIELVTDANEHPSIRSVFIKLQDHNSIKLMVKAGEKIINDLNSILKDLK